MKMSQLSILTKLLLKENLMDLGKIAGVRVFQYQESQQMLLIRFELETLGFKESAKKSWVVR